MNFWETCKSWSLWMSWFIMDLYKIWNTILSIYTKFVGCFICLLRHTYRLFFNLLVFIQCLFFTWWLRKVRIGEISLINNIELTILHTTTYSITIISIYVNIVKIIHLWRKGKKWIIFVHNLFWYHWCVTLSVWSCIAWTWWVYVLLLIIIC